MNDETRQFFGLPLGDWLVSFTSPKYLPMGLAFYLAMFAVMKFVLLLFNATDTLDRSVFELTPAFLLNLPDLQLLFLGSILAGGEAYLQYRTDSRSRYVGMGLAGVMAAGLLLGLYDSGADPTGSNPMRLIILALVLGIVVLDHLSILASSEAAVGKPSRGPAKPVDIDADIDRTIAELMAADSPEVKEEFAELDLLAKEAVEEVKEEEEADETAEFALKDLDAFETWLERADRREDGEQESKERKGEGKIKRALRGKKS